MSEVAPFDREGVAQKYVEHLGQVRGFVRTQVTRTNLFPFIPPSNLRALDFGTGNGHDAIWLAGLGPDSQVFMLDESDEMVGMAEANLAQTDPDQQARLKVEKGGIDKISKHSPYDMILNHGVLMYELERPEDQITTMANSLRTGGVLSLLIKGTEAALNHVPDDEAAREQFAENSQYTNYQGLNLQAVAFSRNRIHSMLSRAGLAVEAEFGVRSRHDADERPITSVDESELDAILQSELDASHDPAQLATSNLLHIVAIKQPPVLTLL